MHASSSLCNVRQAALLNPRTSICDQKRQSHTTNLNSETSGDSNNTFTHCGDVLALLNPETSIAAQGDLVQQGEVNRAHNAAQQAQLQALQSQNQEVCLSQRVRQHPWAGRGSGIQTHAHHKQTNA